jgi:nucleoside-diphosphate-sugar epimerase
MYPAYNQEDPLNPNCAEDSAYPAAPDSEYGWEKLFSERLYMAYRRNYGLQTHIARYHNIFGPEGTWTGGREKALAAICRKIAMARSGEAIDLVVEIAGKRIDKKHIPGPQGCAVGTPITGSPSRAWVGRPPSRCATA